MSLAYGYAEAGVASGPALKAKRLRSETQYHEHFGLSVGGERWDIAVNVGTNDADDLLRFFGSSSITIIRSWRRLRPRPQGTAN